MNESADLAPFRDDRDNGSAMLGRPPANQSARSAGAYRRSTGNDRHAQRAPPAAGSRMAAQRAGRGWCAV